MIKCCKYLQRNNANEDNRCQERSTRLELTKQLTKQEKGKAEISSKALCTEGFLPAALQVGGQCQGSGTEYDNRYWEGLLPDQGHGVTHSSLVVHDIYTEAFGSHI